MKKVIVVMSMVAVCGLMLGACGSSDSGPHCVKIVTCDPACDATTQWCDNTTCKDFIVCDPACATDGTEYCNPMTGHCDALCDPVCETGKYCDDGTCKDNPVVPVCDPVCATGEYCSN
ncbi:MAG TPA: hypothetical protein VM425_11075 [Myxococcota bacterium]|nr:hypothetical protein [Myxococcota bacterium]